jgi:hypothetical protein
MPPTTRAGMPAARAAAASSTANSVQSPDRERYASRAVSYSSKIDRALHAPLHGEHQALHAEVDAATAARARECADARIGAVDPVVRLQIGVELGRCRRRLAAAVRADRHDCRVRLGFHELLGRFGPVPGGAVGERDSVADRAVAGCGRHLVGRCHCDRFDHPLHVVARRL